MALTKRAPTSPQAGDSIRETLSEAFSSGSPKVDREAGVVRGVKVLGTQSRNGHRYLTEALRDAAGLYEGAKVNINHSRDRGQSRQYEDRFGVLRGVALRESGNSPGLYGDLHYNPKHRLAEQFAWDAEHSPAAVGLSHVAEGKKVSRGGETVIEKIFKVSSVDVVADPASTSGLFEDEHQPTGEPDTEREPMTLTLESLKTEHPELVRAVLAEQEQSEESRKRDQQLKTLQEELDRLRVEKAAAERRAKVDALLAEASLPKEACSEVFVEQCLGAKDDNALKALVEDRVSLWKTGGKASGGSGKMQSREQNPGTKLREDQGGQSVDAKSFASAITAW